MSSKLVGTEESVTLNKGSGGYGITMVSNGQGLFVQDVAENGPGHLAGAVTGMRIIEIEGTPADMLAQRDAQQLMSGTSSITIKVIYDPKGCGQRSFLPRCPGSFTHYVARRAPAFKGTFSCAP